MAELSFVRVEEGGETGGGLAEPVGLLARCRLARCRHWPATVAVHPCHGEGRVLAMVRPILL